MSDSVARTLRLLEYLQRRAFWPGPELAEVLQVTPRTLRRDIDRLRRLGYSIESDRGVGGGYALASGRRMPPLVLDDEAVAAIVLGLRAAVGSSIIGIESTALDALSRLESVLPGRLRDRVAEMSERIVWATPQSEQKVAMETLLRLAEAPRQRRCVRFAYTRADGVSGKREVSVGHIVPEARRWYLVAWDLNRGDWRTFRLDRMGDVALSDRSVPDHSAIDAAEARRRVRAGRRSAGGRLAVIWVEGPLPWVRACVAWLHHEILVEPDGALRVELRDDHPTKLVAALSGLASDPSLTVLRTDLDVETEHERAALVERLARLQSERRDG